MEPVRIRECKTTDIEAVLDLWLRGEAVPRPTDRADALHKRIAHDDGLFLLAERKGAIIGSLIGSWDGWRGGMARLVVDPAHRRGGVARALVTEVERRLARLGAERLALRVFHNESGAADFWASAGYAQETAESVWVKNLSP